MSKRVLEAWPSPIMFRFCGQATFTFLHQGRY